MFAAGRSVDDQLMFTNFESTYELSPSVNRDWLVARRNAGKTPADITTELVEAGWDADRAARWSLSSLRSSDHHRLTYKFQGLDQRLTGVEEANPVKNILA